MTQCRTSSVISERKNKTLIIWYNQQKKVIMKLIWYQKDNQKTFINAILINSDE